MEVKIFTRTLKPKLNFWMKPLENIDSGLENDINIWLSLNPSVEIKQSQSGGSWMPSTIVISIWYHKQQTAKL